MTVNIEHSDQLKNRSYRSCIADAFKSTIKGIPHFFKQIWKPIIIVSILQGLLFAWTLHLMPGLLYVGFKMHTIQLALALALAFALYLIIYSLCFSQLNRKSLSWNILRVSKTIPIRFCFILSYIIVTIAISYIYIFSNKNPENIPLLNIIFISFAVLPLLYAVAVPLLYVFTKYQMEGKTKLAKVFKNTYLIGFRNWGFIFTIQFLTALCIIIFEMTACLPLYILIISKNISDIGIASLNDPSGMPSYFDAIAFTTGTFYGCIHITTGFFLANIATNCYQAIEARCLSKNKNN